MAAKFTISAIIKAVDQITAPVARIAARVSAMTAPISRAFGRLGTAAKAAGDKIMGIAGPILAVGAAAASAGLYAVTKGFTDAGDEAATTSKKLGIATSELQRMRYAATMLDVEQGALDASLKKMSKSIMMGSKGAKDQVQALRLLGYTDKQIRSGKISVADATVKLATRMEDERKAKSNAIISNALYGKSYLEMMPMLKEGGQRIRELTEEAERLGLVFDTATAEAMDDSLKRMNFSLTGLRNSIGAGLLPVLMPYVDGLREWVVANREVIATNVTQFVSELAATLKQIDWAAVASGAKSIAEALLWVTKNIDILAAAFVTIKGLEIAVVFFQLAAALKAVGVALALTPMGWFAITIGAVVLAVGYLITHWKEFLGWVERTNAIIEATTAAWAAAFKANFIDPVVAFFDKIMGKIDEFIGRIINAASAIKNLATDNVITRGYNKLFGDAPADTGASAPTGGLKPQAMGGRDANANVVVDFRNMPQGARVDSKVAGKGMNLGVDVGYQTAGAF